MPFIQKLDKKQSQTIYFQERKFLYIFKTPSLRYSVITQPVITRFQLFSFQHISLLAHQSILTSEVIEGHIRSPFHLRIHYYFFLLKSNLIKIWYATITKMQILHNMKLDLHYNIDLRSYGKLLSLFLIRLRAKC